MSLPNEKLLSLEEFYELRKKEDKIMEFIDGLVYMSPSPSTKHQRISMRLSAEFYNYFKGKKCEVFAAPFDIKLSNNKLKGDKIVVPDLSVICDKSGLDDNRYVGVPELIIEILSPSNQAHDLITKMNLYQDYGVKEYWIVNPMLNALQIYALGGMDMYEQVGVFKDKGLACSSIFKDLCIDLEELFS